VGQVFHNIVVVGNLCVGVMCHASKNFLQGAKQFIKIWFLDVKRATRLGRRCFFLRNMGRLGNVIFVVPSLQIDCLVTHKNSHIQGRPLMMMGTCHAPFRKGKICGNHVLRLRGERMG
jgi:hypothetical protein